MKGLNFTRHPPVIAPLAPQDAQALAALHTLAFSYGWDEAAFRNFLSNPQIVGFGARQSGKSKHLSGFILARSVCGEAEILTFAVAKAAQRRGLGQALLEHLLRFLYRERAEALFLEVDESNTAARALYRKCKFKETGRRKAYYEAEPRQSGINAAANARSDAIVLEYRFKRDFSGAISGAAIMPPPKE